MYEAHRRVFSGKKIPRELLEGYWGASYFKKLSERIREYEKQTGLKVDLITYFRAHFAMFGENTYPTHLISESSWDIYRKFRDSLHYSQQDQLNSPENQKKLLLYLAECRDETPEETLKVLRHSGLFTEEFVRSWEAEDVAEKSV